VGRAAILSALLAAGLSQPAAAGDWRARKCRLYTSAWTLLVPDPAAAGLGPAFRAAHDDFLSAGCSDGRVCPVTATEIALADRLTMMAVAEGMAGSFLPFRCPQDLDPTRWP